MIKYNGTCYDCSSYETGWYESQSAVQTYIETHVRDQHSVPYPSSSDYKIRECPFCDYCGRSGDQFQRCGTCGKDYCDTHSSSKNFLCKACAEAAGEK